MRIKLTVLAIVFASSCYALQQNGWNYEKCDGGVKIGGRIIQVNNNAYYNNSNSNVENVEVYFEKAIPSSQCTGIVHVPSVFDEEPLVQIDGLSFLVDSSQCSGFVIPQTVTKMSTFPFVLRSSWSWNAPFVDEATPLRIVVPMRDRVGRQISPAIPIFFKGDKPALVQTVNTKCRYKRLWNNYDYGRYDPEKVIYYSDSKELEMQRASDSFAAGCFVVEGTSGWVTNEYFNGGLVQYYAAKVDIFPEGRRFVDSCVISLSCVNDTATIFYTLDGSEPVANETDNCFRYENPITINKDTEVKAFAYVPAYSSFLENQQLVVTYDRSYVKAVATPTVSQPTSSQFYQSNERVVLSCSTPNSTIRYTTDGSEATSESAIYEAPFNISETTTIRARAFCDGIEDSDEMNVTFTREWYMVDAPVIEPSGAEFENVSQTVSLSCTTDGATIFYTTDGSDPKVNGREYAKPFAIYKSCTVRAIAVKYDWKDSAEATATFTRGESLSEAANLYGYTMETDSAAPWTVDAAVSHDGVSSVRSGAVGNNGTTYLMASVRKAGTVSFWWKAQCEEPDEEDGEDGYYDYGAFLVDDVVKARIAGNDMGWRFVSVEVPTGGKHVLRWEYRKDGATSYAPDCVWVDQVQWSPADGSGYTLTSPEPVPYSWLRQYNLGVASGDFEAAANAASGKTQGGVATSVWEEYVAGTDPTNANSQLKAMIEMQGETLIVTWEPDLNTNGVVRTYKVYGSETLENGGEWQYPTNALHRFFKVVVEMP